MEHFSMEIFLQSWSFHNERTLYYHDYGRRSKRKHSFLIILHRSCFFSIFKGTAYAIDVITIQRLKYGQEIHPAIGIAFVISSQILGYGMAGVMRRFLVWPAAMIWPVNLVSSALFRTLHHNDEHVESTTEKKSRWKMSRLKFFFLAFLCQFIYYWFPGYIFPVLSLFSWICMIKPDDILLSQLTGIRGLGLGAIELDWNAWVSFLGSPIVVPFWLLYFI